MPKISTKLKAKRDQLAENRAKLAEAPNVNPNSKYSMKKYPSTGLHVIIALELLRCLREPGGSFPFIKDFIHLLLKSCARVTIVTFEFWGFDDFKPELGSMADLIEYWGREKKRDWFHSMDQDQDDPKQIIDLDYSDFNSDNTVIFGREPKQYLRDPQQNLFVVSNYPECFEFHEEVKEFLKFYCKNKQIRPQMKEFASKSKVFDVVADEKLTKDQRPFNFGKIKHRHSRISKKIRL